MHTTRYYRGEKIVKGDGVVGYKPGEKVPGDLPKNRAQMEHEEQDAIIRLGWTAEASASGVGVDFSLFTGR